MTYDPSKEAVERAAIAIRDLDAGCAGDIPNCGASCWCMAAARTALIAGHGPAAEDRIKQMVSRFLCWQLPDDFSPDGGISVQKIGNEGGPHEYVRKPSGTNLLDATQAEAMVRHLLAANTAPQADDDPWVLMRKIEAERDAAAARAEKAEDTSREAVKHIGELARELGELQGKQDAMQFVGLLDEWREKCAGLEDENARFREALSELTDLMQGVIDGDYTPDSFTLQPARAALGKDKS